MQKDNVPEVKKAVVVGILLKNEDIQAVEEDLDELEALLITLGYKTAARVIQRREKFVSRSLVGSGKVDEIKENAEKFEADIIVFDKELTPVQVKNLEETTRTKISDRTGIILDIFAKHARTNYAKTQVEIAQLEYVLPRLTGAWTHLQKQTGGSVHARGMGEKQIEVDRRRARDRITKLKRQLEHFDTEKRIQRKSRKDELKVAVVGYTNGGKTTLMNALTKENLLAKDALFATLDTSVRVIDPKTRPKILLSDTVGFIKNLPHSLIESFKSTLDEVKEADLLLHVIDVSHPKYKEQMEITETVLTEINADHIPRIHVFNKIDLVDDPFLPKILKAAYSFGIAVSALKQEDAMKLREHIYKFFEANMITTKIKVKYDDKPTISMIHNQCMILDSDYENPDEITFEIRTTKVVFAKIKPYITEI